MRKKLVICGDSYNTGIGCIDMTSTPYFCLLAEHLSYDVINLARGGSSNYNIFLQGMYAADNIENIGLVILAQTFTARLTFTNILEHDGTKDLSALDINYNDYPPYSSSWLEECKKRNITNLEYTNPIPKHPRYNPVIYTETMSGIQKHIYRINVNPRLAKHPRSEIVIRYKNALIDNPQINRDKDNGLILLAYTYLKKKSIPCLILTPDRKLSNFIDESHIVEVHWSDLKNQYPDTVDSGHTSEIGHRIVSEKIIQKLNNACG